MCVGFFAQSGISVVNKAGKIQVWRCRRAAGAGRGPLGGGKQEAGPAALLRLIRSVWIHEMGEGAEITQRHKGGQTKPGPGVDARGAGLFRWCGPVLGALRRRFGDVRARNARGGGVFSAVLLLCHRERRRGKMAARRILSSDKTENSRARRASSY